MGYTTTCIRRHIEGKSHGELFTTREFLTYGPRGRVDKILFSMVRSGRIVRVARGVFMKPDSPQPSVEYVARTKAEAFGKTLLTHGSAAAASVGLDVQPVPHTFACTGRSTSFWFGTVRIKLVGLAPRKMHLQDTLVGLILRAFWYLGKSYCTDRTVRTVAGRMMRQDRILLRSAAGKMSAWMADLLLWHKPGFSFGPDRVREVLSGPMYSPSIRASP